LELPETVTIAADNPTVERQRFETFPAALEKVPVSDAKKEELYREYLEWRSSRRPPE
jgi:hypothetical protein